MTTNFTLARTSFIGFCNNNKPRHKKKGAHFPTLAKH